MSVPQLASDDYIVSMAKLYDSALPPGKIIYVENSLYPAFFGGDGVRGHVDRLKVIAKAWSGSALIPAP